MAKKMLIDATHTEETRVAIMDGDRLEEFDYESKFRKPLKGSIFLAKVTRVEPSLQAAFVNFGGNRHGFLPFSEIHPDYFRIPVADRKKLMEEQEAMIKEHEEAQKKAEEEEAKEAEEAENQDVEDDADLEEDSEDAIGNVVEEPEEDEDDSIGNRIEDEDSQEDDDRGNRKDGGRGKGRGRGGRGRNNDRGRGGRGGKGGRGRGAQKRGRRSSRYDDMDPEQRFRFQLRRKYKIQEVIKRGQIVLVQASKEERGNKGAAFTTYLSLPGRYCVLMPNSPRAGGVSRKISSYKDRNKMRDLLKELEVPKGMSVIMRTAGVERTKTEVKRDLDYLTKLWNNIRELTLESSAPSLVYEEADLIKRAVRDLYTRDLEEIVVAGEEGHKTAKNFMKMMIPSHVKKVKDYKDEEVPLFRQYKAESQIANIGEVEVTLKSGGYLIINPTEALVSIDVNSGRATKERHIEETALKTNLEAASEVARQLRLRDLGGLVVIDFIDMEDRRNNGKVERRMREALSHDRARVQSSRISMFGLMELSRQRLSPSLTESQYETCSHCQGLGRVRTADATSIMVLRAIEDEGMKKRAAQVIVHVGADVALYILNYKRNHLNAIEERYGFQVLIRSDEDVGASGFRVEVSKPIDGDDDDDGDDGDDEKKSSRGRRGKRGGRRRNSKEEESVEEASEEEAKEEKPKKKAAPKKAAAKKKDDKEEKEEKPKKAAAKKTTAKKKDEKKDDKEEKPKKAAAKKKTSSKKANDDKPSAASEHEKVNEPPKEKKKGWWSS